MPMTPVRPATSGFHSAVVPADGTIAAVTNEDFGTSRWQLSDKATPFSGHGEAGPIADADGQEPR